MRKNTIIVVAYPDRGAGNDPKLFFGGWGVGGSLSPPRLNIFTVGNMGVMICLGQGGLRSLSASSFPFKSVSNIHKIKHWLFMANSFLCSPMIAHFSALL